MEVEEIQTEQPQLPCKFSWVGTSREDSSKLSRHHGEDTSDVQSFKRPVNYSSSLPLAGESNGDNGNRLRGWHHSRIIRVSRASGGKDRHSKVWTSKGLRDRRVRLSVTTAIQFYDLQDRLGFDQPSKAVEWLIKAAAESIADLPSLSGHFPPADQKSDKDPVRSPVTDDEAETNDQCFSQTQIHGSLSKSACSSTSDTSKGSGLSLSRGDARLKARERARERTAKEKEKEKKENHCEPNYQANSSFTELLTTGFASNSTQLDSGGGNPSVTARQVWPFTPMDYIGGGALNGAHCVGRSSHTHLGNPAAQGMFLPPPNSTPFGAIGETNNGGGNHLQQLENLHHFAFSSDHLLLPVAAAAAAASGVDYNLNFTISSSPSISPSGYNRGTLQSNSMSSSSQHHSLLSHLHRYSTTSNASNSSVSSTSMNGPTNYLPFFMDNHHQHFSPPGLQLLYGDGNRNSELRGKGKS